MNRGLALAGMVLMLGCTPTGVEQVGPSLRDVTDEGYLLVRARAMNTTDRDLPYVSATLTVLDRAGATWVESVVVVDEQVEPLAPFESVPVVIESHVVADEVDGFALSFDVE